MRAIAIICGWVSVITFMLGMVGASGALQDIAVAIISLSISLVPFALYLIDSTTTALENQEEILSLQREIKRLLAQMPVGIKRDEN